MIPKRLQNFSLIWRWTAATHAVFPDEILESLEPIDQVSIKLLLDKELQAPEPMYSYHFQSDDETESWLVKQLDKDEEVTLVWDSETGLKVKWETFCRYWDDFCYPASDDVGIFLEGQKLFMLWRHYEVFDYGFRSH